MTVLAAVDIGTNSIHLVVARVDAERFEVRRPRAGDGAARLFGRGT